MSTTESAAITEQMANGAHGISASTASASASPVAATTSDIKEAVPVYSNPEGVSAPTEKSAAVGAEKSAAVGSSAPAVSHVGEPSTSSAAAPALSSTPVAAPVSSDAPAVASSTDAPVLPAINALNGHAAEPSTATNGAAVVAPIDTSAQGTTPAQAPVTEQKNVVASPEATTPPAAAPVPVTSPLGSKEIKKYDKLLKSEAKGEEKSIAQSLKDAATSEKAARKARDAETQSLKRHAKAVTAEHKAAKALSKYTAEHDKAVADLEKAKEDLEIKKKHTTATSEGYEKAKAHIDELRETKAKNDKDRARRASSMHGTASQA